MIRRVLSTVGPKAVGPLLAAVLALHAGVANAQYGPSPMPGGGGPGGGGPGGAGGQEPKHEGVAEAAPKTPGLLPTTPTLPPPKSHRKRLQVLELDGYYRVRTNWFKNFNLGFNDDPTKGGAPFPKPLGCAADPTVQTAPCGNSLSDADMRLRLEPTVNIDETTAFHAQIDMLDNQVLGGTPEGQYLDGTTPPGNIPIVAFSNNVVSPVNGVNDSKSSVEVKRAWGEVGTPLGLVQFGRMPDQWGLGILHNAGGYDPINGTYDFDSDHGDSVDRISFSTLVPGTRIKAMAAIDWPASGIVSTMTNSGIGKTTGQAIDLDDDDDVSQYSVAVSQTDTPTEFRDALDRGEKILDWGGYFQYRTQAWDYSGAYKLGTAPDVTKLVNRNYKAYVFDPWVKFGTGSWLFEGEAVAVVGSVGTIADYCTAANGETCASGSIALLQTGGVARATYSAVEGRLRVGLETGYASGDQYDSQAVINGKVTEVPGLSNVMYARLIPGPGDGNMTQFIFDPDYKIDLILFRHLIGAVTNAIYLRPRLEFDISKAFQLKIWNVTSFAARPVATPGNGAMYGTEFDGDIGYNGPGFFAGFSGGVLFPLGAMSHPADDTADTGGPGFKYDALTNQGDASTAYTIQMRLAVKF